MAGLLTVHPHPDDESIACGGTLARYVDEGIRVVVVTCTGGEAGDNLSGIDLGGEALPVVRRRELAAALEVLGVREHVELGYRDSGMAGTSANDDPASFHRADLDEAARRLAAVIRDVRPDVVVSDDERGTYGHPDHIKAHRVTVRAVEVAADPDEMPETGPPWRVRKRYVHALPKTRLMEVHRRLVERGLDSPFGEEVDDDVPFGVPDSDITAAIDVRAWLGRKRAAIAAHRSQIAPDSLFLNLPDDLSDKLFGREHFVLCDGPPGGVGAVEDDLFAGLT